MTTVAIIQGRMSSRRLPGKILMDVGGVPLLEHVLRRAEAAGVFDVVLLATSTDASDDPVEHFCRKRGTPFFRGSLDDVLDRYHDAACFAKARIIARITADCPLLDPAVVREVVQAFNPDIHDYVSNCLKRTYPDGLDTEVFSMDALTRAKEEARLPSEREHVTPYLHKNPHLFRIAHVTQAKDYSALRWTVDEPRDLTFVRAIYAALGTDLFGQEKILALLEARPELQKLNEGIPNNEGYLLSLQEDKIFLNNQFPPQAA
jgi:spore coat polysaccharide biosynthesis protein SpsF (cytidylyltransferase family)